MSRTGTTGDDWAKLDPRLAHLASRKNLSAPTPRKPKRKVTATPLPMPRREGDAMVLTLPLPHRVLAKNGRTKNINWKASLAKAAKSAAYFLALQVRWQEAPKAVRIDATLWIANRMDDDGAWTMLASYRDGIEKAIGVNDREFIQGSLIQHTGKASEDKRQVEIVITPL